MRNYKKKECTGQRSRSFRVGRFQREIIFTLSYSELLLNLFGAALELTPSHLHSVNYGEAAKAAVDKRKLSLIKVGVVNLIGKQTTVLPKLHQQTFKNAA